MEDTSNLSNKPTLSIWSEGAHASSGQCDHCERKSEIFDTSMTLGNVD